MGWQNEYQPKGGDEVKAGMACLQVILYVAVPEHFDLNALYKCLGFTLLTNS